MKKGACSPERIGNNMSKIIVGEVDWMRNDYLSPITVGGIEYPSVEHAYQASKFRDRDIKKDISVADTVREARQIGKSFSDDLREDWDDVKYDIMENLVRKKFQDDVLAERLAKTGNMDIIMEGYDEYWGTGRYGAGRNKLGDIFKTVRTEVQFMLDLDPSECEESEDPPTLKDALLNGVDDDLAKMCQEMYDGVCALMTMVEPNDFDAAFVARYTGVSQTLAQDAIVKLQKMQSALNSLKDLLGEEIDEPSDQEDSPVHVLAPSDDDWLSPDWD